MFSKKQTTKSYLLNRLAEKDTIIAIVGLSTTGLGWSLEWITPEIASIIAGIFAGIAGVKNRGAPDAD